MSKLRLIFTVMISLLLLNCNKDEEKESSLPEELNFSGSVVSCNDFSISQSLSIENKNIALRIYGTSKENLDLSNEFREIKLPNSDLTTRILMWDGAESGNFCNDVFYEEPNLVGEWKGISGFLKVKISNVEELNEMTLYDITILLKDVTYENLETGDKRKISDLIIKEARVGWMPG